MSTDQRRRLHGVEGIPHGNRPERSGKLKIGEKTLNSRGKEMPTKLDYIKAVDGSGNRVEAFHMTYGDKPRAFEAMFVSNEETELYWERYSRYGSGTGLVCHGNGRVARVEATGDEIPCPCEHAEGDTPTCKIVGSLSFWCYEVPTIGVFQIDTGGLNSIRNIRWFLSALGKLTGGQLAGIPFRIYVEPFQALHNGRASTAYQWKFELMPDMKPADLRAAAQEAVNGFVLPAHARPELDEAKPDDLYTPPASTAAELVEATGEIPREIQAVEDAIMAAATAAGLPGGKINAVELAIAENRQAAATSGNWAGYGEWLEETLRKVTP